MHKVTETHMTPALQLSTITKKFLKLLGSKTSYSLAVFGLMTAPFCVCLCFDE